MLIFDKQHESYQIVGYKQFDTQKPIKAQFLNGGQPIDLSQYYIRFECKKPDGNIVIDDENIVIKDICEIEMSINEQVTVINGEVKCQFVLVSKSDEKQDTTFTFDMDVQQSVIAINGYSKSVVSTAERLNKDILIGNELHSNLLNDIKVGTPLHAQLDEDIKEANKWKDQLHSDVADGKVLQPIIEKDITEAKVTKTQLEQTIAEAQDDIAVIESTGNETVTVLASEWVYSESSKMYEKTITHQCASENIHITCKTSDTKDALFLPWRILDKSKILLKSDEKIGVVINISARYYKPLNLESVDEGEIIEGRGKYNSLNDRMNTFVSFENFTGNTIN